MPGARPHPGLADLPLELLELIVEPLDLKERVRLSCCSRDLLRRLTAAADLWERLDLKPVSTQEARGLVPWLHRHRHAIRFLDLDLNGLDASVSPLPPEWHAVFLVGALGGGALEYLFIYSKEKDGSPVLEVELAGWLADLPRLSELCVLTGEMSAAASFSRLSSLTRLEIAGVANLPAGCLPPSLRVLALHMGEEPVDALPPALAGATGLQDLGVYTLMHDVSGLQNLVSLTSLAIGLGEDGVPDPLLALTGLCSLHLVVTGEVREHELEALTALSMLTCLMLCSGTEDWEWEDESRVVGHLPGAVLALPALQELMINTQYPPTSLRPLPPGGTPVLRELALCTSTASQGPGPATLASLTSLTSLSLYKLQELYYHEQMDAMCGQIPIAALAALMAAVGRLPRLQNLSWELADFGLANGRPLTWDEQQECRAELIQARDAEEAAALQALQSGLRLPPASSTGPPQSLRGLHLSFDASRYGYGGDAGPAELTHKLGLPSWVAGALCLEELAVQGAGEVVEAALNAAAPPGAVTSDEDDD